jgi:hypothetical protein
MYNIWRAMCRCLYKVAGGNISRYPSACIYFCGHTHTHTHTVTQTHVKENLPIKFGTSFHVRVGEGLVHDQGATVTDETRCIIHDLFNGGVTGAVARAALVKAKAAVRRREWVGRGGEGGY